MNDRDRISANFSKNLTHYLNTKDISQVELAKLMGVSAAAVSQWCNGVVVPRVNKIDKICDILNVDRSDLLEERSLFGSITQCYKLPVIGSIAGGTPIDALQDMGSDEWIEVSAKQALDGRYIALRVNGNSMEPIIYDGSIAIIKLCYEWHNNAVMAVYVGEYEATLKKVRIETNGILSLQPFNPEHETRVFTPEQQKEFNVKPVGILVEHRKKWKQV